MSRQFDGTKKTAFTGDVIVTAQVIEHDPKPPPPITVVLEVGLDTARALLKVLRNVGGHPERTPRGSMDVLQRALLRAGIEPLGNTSGSGVVFKEEKDG